MHTINSIVLPLLATLLLLVGDCNASTDLPVGSAPPAVKVPHFPSPLHAVVWRNWELVPKERIAAAVKGTPEQVSTIAETMGLPPQPPIAPEMKERGYITIIRRNWHLLPYDQLLTILDLSADELASRLREDDFLYIKLGNLKPKCEPVIYKEPGTTETERAAQIKRLIKNEFGESLTQQGEPRFGFLKNFDTAPTPTQGSTSATTESLRFIYSYFAPFGDPLINADLDPYPDVLLAQLQAQGVNGVWLHVVLRDLAPGGSNFPEFGKNSKTRLQNLRALSERCARYGIKIYLYINEPRAMTTSFFVTRSSLKGVTEGDFHAMCTSDSSVLEWITDALSTVFQDVPALGGVFTITASENLTHCASHFGQEGCSRCSKRSPSEIIAEVNKAIRDGVRKSAPNARVICYDWGWNHHGDAPEVIAALPSNVDLMSVSEWALPLGRGGIKTTIGEYSVSAVGPGPRASRHWELAKNRRLGTVAKVQFNNSWEMSAVPWLPVEDLVASHSVNLAKAGVDGMMLSWSLGGYPSPNLQVAQLIGDNPDLTADEALNQVARSRYGPDAVADIRAAWTGFSSAFQHFPYHTQVLYNGPQHVGPANLLFPEPTGYSATMVGFPYDDLKSWCGPYPVDVWVAQFDKMTQEWELALRHLRAALTESTQTERPTLEADIGLAETVGIHFASCLNQARFISFRDNNDKVGMAGVLNQECDLAKRLYWLTKSDSRIGFEASNHYYYVPLDLVEKVVNCRWLEETL